MAFEVPVPRSYQTTLGDIIATFQARYGISRLKVGGAILTAFEAAAQSDVRSTQDVFNTLDLEDTSRLRGSALEFKALSEGVEKLPATPSSGTVDILETRFAKISSRIYSGTPPIPAGSTTLRVVNALGFPNSGQVYVGRGTVNSEGPLSYTAKTNMGQYWQLTLSSATQKFHNINEEIVVSQGGNRQIPVGTVCGTARDGRTTPVDFQTTAQAILLDGEIIVRNVPVICRQPGTVGNVPFGAIKVLSSPPFPGATVTNPKSFDNGLNVESDDELVDRLRKAKASKSRGTETAILYGVQGVFSTEESKRVISASLVRPAGEPATLYIDDGTGYEEQNTGIAADVLIDSAGGGEQYFSLTARRPIAKAYVKSGGVAPFTLEGGATLAVLVGGVLNTHTFTATDFVAISSATAQEVVSSINANPDIDFSARTADGGARVALFARADIGEDLQVTQPESGIDANDFLVFSTSPTYTLKLYKNDILLYKDGKEAVITGAAQSFWTSMSTGIQLNVAVDGTASVTYTFTDADFVAAETGFSAVSQTNSVDAWVAVINRKIPGITAENGGGFIVLKSNRGRLSTASIVLSAPGGANLISAGMFTSSLGLEAFGINKDYTLDRMTGQIKLAVPLVATDSLTVGSTSTRGYIQSINHATAAITLTSLARFWVAVDSAASKINVNTTTATQFTTTTVDNDRTTYTANVTTAFGTSESLLRQGDYVIIWDPNLNAHGAFRICGVPSTAPFDNFTVDRPATATQSGAVLASDGMRFYRLAGGFVQEVRLVSGVNRSLTSIADEINTQLVNATASVYRNTFLRLSTNDYDQDNGDVTVLTADTEAQKLGFTLASTDPSILSHLAFTQSRYEVGTPRFDSTSYVDTPAGDLFDNGADNQLAFTAINAANVADPGLLAYFMRRVQQTDNTQDHFGGATDQHFPLVDATFGTLTRVRLRKNDVALTLTSLVRSGTTVTATVTGHRYVPGDLVWVQRLNTADANFPSGVKAVVSVTSNTFVYTEAGASTSAITTYTCNLWDGVNDAAASAVLGDGFVLTSPYSITPRDSLNIVLNSDETNQSYSIPMRRRVQPTSSTYGKGINVNVVDVDNSGAPLSTLFGTSDPTYFTDFWAFMQARTVSHKNVPDKAVLWRAQRFGPECHGYRISYANPRIDDTAIGHGIEFMSDRTMNVYLYMPHGSVRTGTSLFATTRFTWVVSTVGVYKQIVFSYSSPAVSLAKSGTTVTATSGGPHGFSVGDTVYITGSTDGLNYPNGAKVVTATPLSTTFQYVDVAGGTTASATASSAPAAPDFTSVVVGDVAIIVDDGSNDLSPTGSWRVYAKTTTTFTVRVPVANSITTQATPQKLGNADGLVFAPIDTANATASDFVDYVTNTDDIKDLIGGILLGTGSSAIDTSTADEYFQAINNTSIPSSVDRWAFTDGLNYVLTSNLAVTPNTIQFKQTPTSVELQSSVNFTDEEIHLVPVTASNVAKWLRTPAISGAYATTDFEVVGRDRAVQATSRIQGSTGGVQVTGGLANEAAVVLLGSGENYLSAYGRVAIDTDDTQGLLGGSWIALSNSLPTPKALGLSSGTTIQVAADGRVTFSVNIWTADGAAVVTSGDMITIQRVGSFLAYIFMSTAVLPAQAAVGSWIDFQVPAANSSNRGRRRIVGVTSSGGYKVVWVENPDGISEVVAATGDEVEFYSADSVLPGDTLDIGYAVGGYVTNMGSFTVTALGSSGTNVIVNKVFTATGPVALGTNVSTIRVTEPNFRLIERLDFIGPNPSDFSRSYAALYPQASRTLLDRLNPNLGAQISVLDKLGFPDDPSVGVDGYAISTGLIGQVAKVLYGDPNSPTLFPGLVAVGATVFISGPNAKRIRISLQIRIRTGVPQATLVERVRASVSSEINRIPLGTAVDISRLVAAARRVQGVVSVVVLSPTYGVGNDTISVQANEKPFVFDPQSDIAVTVVT